MQFEGRNVVVTGGTGALGQAVLRALASAGAACFVPHLGSSRPAVDGLDTRSVTFVDGIDLSDEEATAKFYATVPDLWASIHCAGGFAMAPIADTGSALWESMYRINLLTCFFCCREAVKGIRRRDPGPGGRIVNVAARPALEPRTGARMTAYTAAKAAVAALTLSLGEEVAPEQIWVNAIVPSILDTPANRRAMPKADFTTWTRLEDAAATVIFLASPENRATRCGLVPV